MQSSGRRSLLPATAAGLALALTLVPACAPAAPEASAEEAEAAFREFAAAWEREDLDAAVDAFTADAVAFDPVPPGKFEGTEGIRAWIEGGFQALENISITLDEVEATTHGPFAQVTSRFVFAATQDGQPFQDEGYVSTVWIVDEDGAYRSTLFHASPLPEEEAMPEEEEETPGQ